MSRQHRASTSHNDLFEVNAVGQAATTQGEQMIELGENYGNVAQPSLKPASRTQLVELQPLALAPLAAARFLSVSKRTLSRLIAAGKIEARKDGGRTLVDVASLKAYYRRLPLKAPASHK
jgi:excisionase family DNA binding protein